MTAYSLLIILAVGIPFLLYCLWNFSRELRPRTSNAVLHGNHARQAAARTYRTEEGVGHRGPQRPSAEAVFRAARQFARP